VSYSCLDAARIRHELLDFGEGFVQRLLGDVGHEHVGAFFGEQDAGFEADAAVQC
jgi:hypothetical protein